MECEQLTELQFQVRKLEKELKEHDDRALTVVMELQTENKRLRIQSEEISITDFNQELAATNLKLQAENKRLKEQARLFELEIKEAEEALLGLEIEKATEIIEKALKALKE